MAARVERLAWRDIAIEAVDLGGARLELTLGLGSGLSRREDDAPGRIFALTDRGPNLFVSEAVSAYGLSHLQSLSAIRDAKIMPRPEAGPEIVELAAVGDGVRLVRRLPLKTRSGVRLGGAAPAGSAMEQVFDPAGTRLRADPLGADAEAIALMPDGSFFIAEEYCPSLLKVDAGGVVTERWVAPGAETGVDHSDIIVRGVLPGRVARRRLNRGLEALCASSDGRWLYLGLQSAPAGDPEGATPVWKLDAVTGALAAEWRYPFDAPETFVRDAARRRVGRGDLKICEFAWAGDDRLIVLERIAHTTKLYAVDLARLPEKQLLMSSDDHPEMGSDMEGMTLLSREQILLVSDNDFGVEGAETQFWRITLDAPV